MLGDYLIHDGALVEYAFEPPLPYALPEGARGRKPFIKETIHSIDSNFRKWSFPLTTKPVNFENLLWQAYRDYNKLPLDRRNIPEIKAFYRNAFIWYCNKM